MAMSASPRQSAEIVEAQPQHTGCENVRYQEVIADPHGEAIVTTVIPEEGVLIEAGDGHFRVQQSEQGIVFSALRMPRHAAPQPRNMTDGRPSWADRPADESVLLPDSELVPVEYDERNVMGVVAAQSSGSLTVSAANRDQAVRVFTPLPPEQQ